MMKYLLMVLMLVISGVSQSEKLATIETSGMVFKDSLEVWAFDDPTVKNVVCYVTQPKRSLSWDDPTNTSISCRKHGKITSDVQSQRKIFKTSKNPFLKKMFVDRIYDSKRNMLLYVAYTEKLSGDNASNSISVVNMND